MEIKLELKDKSFTINGVEFAGEIEVDKLKEILGEPRACKEEPDKNYRAYMEKRRGKDYFESAVCLVWDDVGIYTHSDDGKVLRSFGIVFDNTQKTAVHTPKSNFSGTLLINGYEWLSSVKAGQNMFGTYCKLALENYVVFAEYTPEKKSLSLRTAKDFRLIEITHAY